MLSFSNLNPAVFVYIWSTIVFVARRFLGKSKQTQHFACLALLSFPVLLILHNLLSFNVGLPYPFVLRKDWITAILVSRVDLSSFIMLIALFFITILLFIDYFRTPFLVCMRSTLHIGAAIGVIFASDAISTLFYCELVAIISIATVISDRSINRRKAMTYLVLHVLSGALMLGGFISMILGVGMSSSGIIFFSQASTFLVLASVALTLGVWPFGFAVVDIYGEVDSRNLPILGSILTKLVLFSVLPLMQYLSAESVTILSSIILVYVIARMFYEKSLSKTIILWTMVHSSTVLYSFGSADKWFNSTIAFYIATNMVVSFYLFCVLRFFTRIIPELSNNISFLGKIRKVPSFAVKINILFLFLLLFGFPGTIIYLNNTAIDYVAIDDKGFIKYILFSDIISISIAWRIFFAYFSPKRFVIDIKIKQIANKTHLKGILFGFFGFLFTVSGYFMRDEIINFVGANCQRCYGHEDVKEYFIIFIITGIAVGTISRIVSPIFRSDDISSLAIEKTIGVWNWINRHFLGTYLFFDRMIYQLLYFSKGISRILIRKSVVGVFANMYGADVILCIMGMIFAILMMYCAN